MCIRDRLSLAGIFLGNPQPLQPFLTWSRCRSFLLQQKAQANAGAHKMEPPSAMISWVNPFPSRFTNRTIFFRNALESHECTCCLLSFIYFLWLFPLLAHETSSGNRSIYKSSRERVDSKDWYGRWRLPLMGSWQATFLSHGRKLEVNISHTRAVVSSRSPLN